MDFLGDDVIYEIACWMSAEELLAFGQTNKRFYIISNDEHLWRKYEEKLLREINVHEVDDETPSLVPDQLASAPLKSRIRFLSNWNDYTKESTNSSLYQRSSWAYYFKVPMWELDLFIRIIFAITILTIDRVKIMYQLNLDQASWNPLETTKYIYNTEGLGAFFIGWQYRLLLLLPIIFRPIRRYAFFMIFGFTGMEVRDKLGYHMDGIMQYAINWVVGILITALLGIILRWINNKMGGALTIRKPSNYIVRLLLMYLSESLLIYIHSCQYGAFEAISNFFGSLFVPHLYIGLVLHIGIMQLRRVQIRAIAFKTKLGTQEREQEIFKKYLNKTPFKLQKLKLD
jgi:hypothetical protein